MVSSRSLNQIATLTSMGPDPSQLSGVAIPQLPEIAGMRWTTADNGGVNAAPWIHLYMLTIAGLVIVPRLLLSLWQELRALRFARNLPVASREDFYIRRLLRSSGTGPGRARITPYAYRPGEETRRRLAATIKTVLGDGAEVRFDQPVEYGSEDDWVSTHGLDPDEDYHLLLFTLSATPEAENHGQFAQAVAVQGGQRDRGTIVGALIDESPFRAHFAGQTGLEERVQTRLEAWRRTLSPAGVIPIGVDLSQTEGDELAKRIESNLIPDAELRR